MNIPGCVERKGLTYRRFRFWVIDKVTGKRKRKDRYIRLPHPTDPRFAAELARVNAEAEKADTRQGPLPGSFGALAVDFRIALNNGWTKKKRKKGARPLAVNTIANYGRYIAMFEDGTLLFENKRTGELSPVRDMPVKGMRPTHVYQLRDSMAEFPGKANNWLNVLKIMMTFACERDWRGDNPAAEISPLPIGEHEPWPRAVLGEALDKAGPMTRLAIVTGLCSGQRLSDCIKIWHNWLSTGVLELSQLKTGVDVAVPVHPWWRAEIDAIDKKAVTILYDRFGRPFRSEDRIQERIRRLMHELGYVDDKGQVLYTFHGLRKNACCYLLEAGIVDTDVGLILGMTPDTVRHYGKKAKALMVATRTAEIMGAIPLSKMGR